MFSAMAVVHTKCLQQAPQKHLHQGHGHPPTFQKAPNKPLRHGHGGEPSLSAMAVVQRCCTTAMVSRWRMTMAVAQMLLGTF